MLEDVTFREVIVLTLYLFDIQMAQQQNKNENNACVQTGFLTWT